MNNLRVLALPGLRVRNLNPYTWLLYSNMQARVDDYSLVRAALFHYDLFHIHWPEWELNIYQSPTRTLASLKAKLLIIDHVRSKGTKIVWTAHNLTAHDSRHPQIEQWFWNEFTNRLDGVIALSASGLKAAKERFPVLEYVPGFVVPHGHYRDEYSNDVSVDSREYLGLRTKARIFLFFGRIRAYKNIPGLVKAFRQMQDPESHLLIAGRPENGELRREVEALASLDPRVRLDLEFVRQEQVQHYMRAADLVVLPYRDILNSGTALLALSFNRPVLVPYRGAMGELASSVGPAWVRTYAGDINEEQLRSGMDWARNAERTLEAPLGHLDWRDLRNETLKVYLSVLSRECSAALVTHRRVSLPDLAN